MKALILFSIVLASSSWSFASAEAFCTVSGISAKASQAIKSLSVDVVANASEEIQTCIIESEDKDVRRRALQAVLRLEDRVHELNDFYRNLP